MISEELKARGEEALLYMLDGLEKAADFTVEQAPFVVQELLAWHMIRSLLFFSIAVILCFSWIPALIIARHGIKESPWTRIQDGYCKGKTTDAFDFSIGISIAGGGILTVIGFMAAINSLEWLQIMIAPRLYLLEYAAELVK